LIHDSKRNLSQSLLSSISQSDRFLVACLAATVVRTQFAKDKAGTVRHDVIFTTFFAGSAGTGQCWHWHKYVDKVDAWRHFKGFADAVRGIDPPAEAFTPLMVQHKRLRVYVLQGKRTTLMWCRDKENWWKPELEQGRVPEELKGIVLKLAGDVPLAGRKVRIYDPWKKRWSDASVEDGSVRLPAFSRSIVVRAEVE
jgi:hypothetical protein